MIDPTISASPASVGPAPEGHRLRVAILGASGSVGTQTLDVCRRHADKVRVTALSVLGSTERLVSAAREFGVSAVAVVDETHGKDPILQELPAGCELGVGTDAALELVTRDDVDCVVCAVVGAAGIRGGYAALKAGKRLGYANKESIVVAGDLLMPLVKPGALVPIDSEHSAIFQCLRAERPSELERIWLTCSGGPFFGMNREELSHVTATDALRHPTWRMGAKITIDSATLMNKGLEVLEARRIFDAPLERISVLVHRQSRVHSMVEFSDGSVKAQLGPTDMRIPIQYALSYPERWETPCARVDYAALGELTFEPVDEGAFGCLRLAREAGLAGGTIPCVLNAANEVANHAFRKGSCGFLDIERVVERTVDAFTRADVQSLEQLAEVDARARDHARNELRGLL